MTVLLIANRIDHRDRTLVAREKKHDQKQAARSASSGGVFGRVGAGSSAESAGGGGELQVHVLETRLTKDKVYEVMQKDGIHSAVVKERIWKWCLGSRLVFGDESVSLRILADLKRILTGKAERRMQDLERLLLHKVPTVSRLTAEQFVDGFLRECGLGGGNFEPATAVLFRVAMLDEKDELCSFPEFLDKYSSLYSHPACVRLLGWCGYVLHATGASGPGGRAGGEHGRPPLDLSSILDREYSSS